MLVKPRETEIFRIPERFKPFIKIVDIQEKNDIRMLLLDVSICFQKPVFIWVPPQNLPLYDLVNFFDENNPNFKYSVKAQIPNKTIEIDFNQSYSKKFQFRINLHAKKLYEVIFGTDFTFDNWFEFVTYRIKVHSTFEDFSYYNILTIPNDFAFILINGVKRLLIKNKNSPWWKSFEYSLLENNLMKDFELIPSKAVAETYFFETCEWSLLILKTDGFEHKNFFYNGNKFSQDIITITRDNSFHIFKKDKAFRLVDMIKLLDSKHDAILIDSAYTPLKILAEFETNPDSFFNHKLAPLILSLPDFYLNEDFTNLKRKLGYTKAELNLYIPFDGLSETISWWIPTYELSSKNIYYKHENPFYYNKLTIDKNSLSVIEKLRPLYNFKSDNKQIVKYMYNSKTKVPEWLTNTIIGIMDDIPPVINNLDPLIYYVDNTVFTSDYIQKMGISKDDIFSKAMAVFTNDLKTCVKLNQLSINYKDLI